MLKGKGRFMTSVRDEQTMLCFYHYHLDIKYSLISVVNFNVNHEKSLITQLDGYVITVQCDMQRMSSWTIRVSGVLVDFFENIFRFFIFFILFYYDYTVPGVSYSVLGDNEFTSPITSWCNMWLPWFSFVWNMVLTPILFYF